MALVRQTVRAATTLGAAPKCPDLLIVEALTYWLLTRPTLIAAAADTAYWLFLHAIKRRPPPDVANIKFANGDTQKTPVHAVSKTPRPHSNHC